MVANQLGTSTENKHYNFQSVSTCSCSKCESINCVLKSHDDPLNKCSCDRCTAINTCLYYKDRSSLLSQKEPSRIDNPEDLNKENVVKEQFKKEVIYEFNNTIHDGIAQKNESILNNSSSFLPLAQDQSVTVVKSSRNLKSISRRLIEPSSTKQQSELFKQTITREAIPKLTKYEVFQRIVDAYKACSCKVCDCITGNYLCVDNKETCNCIPCQCADCQKLSKRSKYIKNKTIASLMSITCKSSRRKDDTFKIIYETTDCKCKPCQCVLCTSAAASACDCKPCQCIECTTMLRKRKQTFVIAPVGEQYPNSRLRRRPYEYTNNYNTALSSHTTQEMSTNVDRHPKCQCELCTYQACKPDDTGVCLCQLHSKIMSKPLEKDVRNYDVHQASVLNRENDKNRPILKCNNDTIAMFATIVNNMSLKYITNIKVSKAHLEPSIEGCQTTKSNIDQTSLEPIRTYFPENSCTKLLPTSISSDSDISCESYLAKTNSTMRYYLMCTFEQERISNDFTLFLVENNNLTLEPVETNNSLHDVNFITTDLVYLENQNNIMSHITWTSFNGVSIYNVTSHNNYLKFNAIKDSRLHKPQRELLYDYSINNKQIFKNSINRRIEKKSRKGSVRVRFVNHDFTRSILEVMKLSTNVLINLRKPIVDKRKHAVTPFESPLAKRKRIGIIKENKAKKKHYSNKTKTSKTDRFISSGIVSTTKMSQKINNEYLILCNKKQQCFDVHFKYLKEILTDKMSDLNPKIMYHISKLFYSKAVNIDECTTDYTTEPSNICGNCIECKIISSSTKHIGNRRIIKPIPAEIVLSNDIFEPNSNESNQIISKPPSNVVHLYKGSVLNPIDLKDKKDQEPKNKSDDNSTDAELKSIMTKTLLELHTFNIKLKTTLSEAMRFTLDLISILEKHEKPNKEFKNISKSQQFTQTSIVCIDQMTDCSSYDNGFYSDFFTKQVLLKDMHEANQNNICSEPQTKSKKQDVIASRFDEKLKKRNLNIYRKMIKRVKIKTKQHNLKTDAFYSSENTKALTVQNISGGRDDRSNLLVKDESQNTAQSGKQTEPISLDETINQKDLKIKEFENDLACKPFEQSFNTSTESQPRSYIDSLKVWQLGVRRVSDHTILVQWNKPKLLTTVVGYELLVDGRSVQKLTPSCCTAAVTCLPLNEAVLITVRTLAAVPPSLEYHPSSTVVYRNLTKQPLSTL